MFRASLEHGAGAPEAIGITGEHAIGGHFPYITMLRTGYREFNLLKSRKTNIASASKNVAIDTGSALAGMKAGALAGLTLGGPHGAIIGGILGLIKGKSIGAALKERDLKSAITEYEQHAENLKNTQANLIESLEDKFNRKKKQEQDVLDRLVSNCLTECEKANPHFEVGGNSQRAIKYALAKLISSASKELEETLVKITAQVQSSSSWKKSIWPNVEEEALGLAHRRIIRIADTMSKLELLAKTKNGAAPSSFVLNFLAETGMAEEAVRHYISDDALATMKKRTIYQDKLQAAHADITLQRFKSVQNLDNFMKQLADEVQIVLEPLVTRLEELGKHVIREQEKLGLA